MRMHQLRTLESKCRYMENPLGSWVPKGGETCLEGLRMVFATWAWGRVYCLRFLIGRMTLHEDGRQYAVVSSPVSSD